MVEDSVSYFLGHIINNQPQINNHSFIPFNSASKAHKTTGKSNDIENTQT